MPICHQCHQVFPHAVIIRPPYQLIKFLIKLIKKTTNLTEIKETTLHTKKTKLNKRQEQKGVKEND